MRYGRRFLGRRLRYSRWLLGGRLRYSCWLLGGRLRNRRSEWSRLEWLSFLRPLHVGGEPLRERTCWKIRRDERADTRAERLTERALFLAIDDDDERHWTRLTLRRVRNGRRILLARVHDEIRRHEFECSEQLAGGRLLEEHVSLLELFIETARQGIVSDQEKRRFLHPLDRSVPSAARSVTR